MMICQHRRKTRHAAYAYRNIEVKFCNYFCCGKAIICTYSEYVFISLSNQHAKNMRSILLLLVLCLSVTYFSTLSHKRHYFQKIRIEISFFKTVQW
jgi:hypothetical protein